MLEFVLLFVGLFIMMLAYFNVANYFNIIDKPNERSSHTQITIRGGGVLFPLSWFVYEFIHGFHYPWMTIGVLLIATISFLDDRMELSSRFRFLIHTLAFTACFYQLQLFGLLPWWGVIGAYIVGIGCLNAVNFMDGINGMTGLYALSVLLPLQWFWFQSFWNASILNYLSLAILVFGFYNFRKKAKCFAGDVGSITIGYMLVFFLLALIFNRVSPNTQTVNYIVLETSNVFSFDLKYILLLTLYGLDAILTLVQRLYLQENIFQAHRRHLYQLLVNEYGHSHLLIAGIYAVIQSMISIWIFNNSIDWISGLVFLILGTVLYSLFKRYLIMRIKSA